MLSDLDISAIPFAKIPALIAALAARLLAEPEESAPAATAPISTPSDKDRMLTVKEVAGRLRCSAKTIYRRVEAGELPFARRNGGRALIFSEQGLTKWLARQRG